MCVRRFTAILILGVASLGASAAADAQSFNAEPIRAGVYVFNATKAYRIEKLGPEYNFRTNPKGHRFTYHMKLSMVAQQYAEYLARLNASGHTADGRTPQQRVEQAGIKHCGVSENVHSSGRGRPRQRGLPPQTTPWRSGRHQPRMKKICVELPSTRWALHRQVGSMASSGITASFRSSSTIASRPAALISSRSARPRPDPGKKLPRTGMTDP